jgi:hypothetical protein
MRPWQVVAIGLADGRLADDNSLQGGAILPVYLRNERAPIDKWERGKKGLFSCAIPGGGARPSPGAATCACRWLGNLMPRHLQALLRPGTGALRWQYKKMRARMGNLDRRASYPLTIMQFSMKTVVLLTQECQGLPLQRVLQSVRPD